MNRSGDTIANHDMGGGPPLWSHLRTSLPRPGRSQDGCRSQLKAKLEAVREFGARRRSLNWNALPTEAELWWRQRCGKGAQVESAGGPPVRNPFRGFPTAHNERGGGLLTLKQSWKEVPRRLRYAFEVRAGK